MDSSTDARWRRIVVASGWTAVLAPVVTLAIGLVAGDDGRPLARLVLVVGAAALTGCAIGALVLATSFRHGGWAWVAVVGSVGGLASLIYLSTIRDEPTAIPLAGVGGLLVSLVLVGVASTSLRGP